MKLFHIAVLVLASFGYSNFAAEDRAEVINPPCACAECKCAKCECKDCKDCECALRADEVPKAVLFAHYRIAIYSEALFNRNGETVEEARLLGYGTGIAIAPRSILTARHVADGERGIEYHLEMFDADGVMIGWQIARFVRAGQDHDTDLALLSVKDDLPFFLKNFALGKVDVGQRIYDVGAALGLAPFNVTWGTLASKNDEASDESQIHGLWQATLGASPGCSGGGVYNTKNELVGVLTMGAPGTPINFFVPVQLIAAFLNQK